ncbi:hypothetical protein GCM10011575_19230 [Microlunatus endophyticus]|uniref:Uncharacterized protein n=1 Tax=Microlunatus endophyticus TaxID=1716077 RepID=A0A917S6X9_9ACTN|nr:hypothetical protein [Microlunatus endophyticus]GGL60834.1 hypothetical protein GCM10011575_19230 [Microlunatus endophyticus]
MPAQELIFVSGDLEVTVGAAGFPVRVRCAGRPGQDYFAAQYEPGPLIMDGRPQRWEPVGLVTDVDETEARYALVDHPELEYTVRNSFAGHWQQRHMLVNTSSATIVVDRWQLALAPAPGCLGWGSAIGGDATWAVQPTDGQGPLVFGELVQGSVTELVAGDEPGVATGTIVLSANRRIVLQWRIDTAADTASIARTRQPVLSGRTDLGLNQAFEVADPDSAVVSEDPVMVSTEGDLQVLTSDRAGRYPVELRSGRGTTVLDLAWVPGADELVATLSRTWLDHRSGAGIGVIPGPGAALGLQQAVIGRLTDEVDDAEDALALHTGRLLDRPEISIMDQAYLAQESVRTGDPEPLRRARSAFLEIDRPEPGVGLAATRICLAELALGGSPAEVIGRLQEIARAAAPDDGDHGDRGHGDRGHGGRDHGAEDDLVRAAAWLELITVTGPSAGQTSDSAIRHALAVGAGLGSGLPGARIGTTPPGVTCYAAAVLDLLPDRFGSELEQRWGMTAHTLADQARTSALAAALFPKGPDPTPNDLDQTIGWVVLGKPIE